MATPNLRTRILNRLLGDAIEARVSERVGAIEAGFDQALAAAISVRIDDSPGWDQLSGGTAIDRPWADRKQDLDEALDAWTRNFFVRRIVTLTTTYVVGNGIAVSSDDKDVAAFIASFWSHPLNHMDRRLRPMCDELTRSAELFPILHTNKIDGMSYIRFIPASRIDRITTDPDDYETELDYHQMTIDAEGKTWYGPHHPDAYKKDTDNGDMLPPLMLHFAINRPIGATRGESDLLPLLPWAKRYAQWLQDRVRLNRQRTRNAILDVEVDDHTQVEAKRLQLQTNNPIHAGIYVHGTGERAILHSLKIEAADVKDDGQALRLAVATAGNVGLHYFGEGGTVNYATAREMGEPTARFYSDRQDDYKFIIADIVEHAYRRFLAHKGDVRPPAQPLDLKLKLQTTEVARADNESLAKAAREIAEAFTKMAALGWIDAETAATLCFKFAGEPLGPDEIRRILSQAEPPPDQEKESTE